MRLRKIAARLLLALLVASGSGPVLAQVLVLRSVGPSAGNYPAGRRLPDNATLVLRSGDSVTVLRRSGTRVFRGPGSVRVDAPLTVATSRTGSSRGIRIGVGAVRGLDDNASRPPDVWLIDAASTQTACVRTGHPIELWRAEFVQATDVVVTSANARTRIDWPAGQQTLRLPAATAAGDGAVLEISRPGAQRPIRITLAQIEVDAADREAVAMALMTRNCRNQIDTFAALNDEETAATD